jgi:thioredoxin 1
MNYLEITDENFQDQVFDSKLPVVVDFWAPWCEIGRAHV